MVKAVVGIAANLYKEFVGFCIAERRITWAEAEGTVGIFLITGYCDAQGCLRVICVIQFDPGIKVRPVEVPEGICLQFEIVGRARDRLQTTTCPVHGSG